MAAVLGVLLSAAPLAQAVCSGLACGSHKEASCCGGGRGMAMATMPGDAMGGTQGMGCPMDSADARKGATCSSQAYCEQRMPGATQPCVADGTTVQQGRCTAWAATRAAELVERREPPGSPGVALSRTMLFQVIRI